MLTGKLLRMRRVFRKGRSVVVPYDHALFSGPLKGIEDPRELTKLIAAAEADAVLITPGVLEYVKDHLGDLAVILRIDGTHTKLGSHLERIKLITTVEHALRLGADMVVVNVFVGTNNEDDLLEKLGVVATKCSEWGMPLMGEMIPASLLGSHYGKEDKDKHELSQDISLVARLGAEIGADIIKTHYCGDAKVFAQMVDSTMVPIVIAGGPKTDSDEEFLNSIRSAIMSGAAGIAIGRNVWQHSDPKRILDKLCSIVHG